ncbi:MAG TPA: sigma-70 family RNA polymerase sigma factor [Actinomycetota bacterium]|nr:sigma-70 family RNA polymerase sigma factor [Actinomycetota bacterium]
MGLWPSLVVVEDVATGEPVEAGRIEGRRLELLYRAHATKAARTAYLLTGDAALADDLVQEAFVRLAGRFVDWRREDGFEPYLRRTIVNLFRTRLRRIERERERHRRVAASPVAAGGDLADLIAVRDALMRLSERQRAAVVLRYYEDLPEAEIADLIGCRPGTVKSLLSRAMDALRAELSR